MKNYFNFNLTGRKLLPIWILFLILIIAPYVLFIIKMSGVQPGTKPSLLIFPIFILFMIIVFILTFYLAKLTIENISFKDKSIVFNGNLGKYIGTVLLGLFLSIITLGIYLAWFIKDIHKFFINNSNFNSQNLIFQGKGVKLFVILLLTIMIPVMIISFVMAALMINNPDNIKTMMFIQQLVMIIILVPYTYLIYKWMVNIDYKGYNISWDTNFWKSCGKIALETIIIIATIGIYFPLAGLRLYKYFTDRTVATSNERKLKFGYDIDQLNDFLFIWGQTLLAIITLGIYYPWAFCKIGNRILSKTYLVEAAA